MPSIDAAIDDIDTRFRRVQADAGIPGLAWGVVQGGHLVHASGIGTTRDGAERRPDADSVFRIASMTKSFTAATLLGLRDDGLVRLDAPVADYVPELSGWAPGTADSGPVTVRQLLTMSAGLPTDDPWGDRQQALDLDRFAGLLRAGPTLAWPPGTTFEYSNLGYGILGRVITNATGMEYDAAVRQRILRPLGMGATTYRQEDVPEPVLVHGYVRRDEQLVREGTDGYGALASMGGLFSSVRDLATWVAGFLDAWPARDDPEGLHPLRRSSRREMQQVHRAIVPDTSARPLDADIELATTGYGFGLAVTHDLALGTMVGHAGGYPGFGSHMVWHPATGLGVIGLGNRRYAPVRPVVAAALADLVRSHSVERRAVRPSVRVLELQHVVDGLLTDWDDGVADDVFAMNMDLDEPRDLRRAAIDRVASGIGLREVVTDGTRPGVPAATSVSPADLTWWRRGTSGAVRVSILVTPEPEPRIQRLDLHAVGDPSATMIAVAEAVLALADDRGTTVDLPIDGSPTFERGALESAMRAGRVRFGAIRLGRPSAGDGLASTTFELETDRGNAELVLTLDPVTHALDRAILRERERNAPPEAW